MKEQLKLVHRAWRYRLAESGEINYLLQNIKKGTTVFDIGAHKGAYTYWMQKAAGKQGRVVAFEPQQAGVLLLRQVFTAPVTIEHLALSDHTGTAIFYIQPQSVPVSYEASLDNRYAAPGQETVSVTTVDQYCKDRDLSPSFLKIDVEGHELKLLRGATNTIAKFKPTLLIEIEQRHVGAARMNETFAFLKGYGYQGYFFAPGGKRPLDTFDPDIHQQLRHQGTKKYCNNFVFE